MSVGDETSGSPLVAVRTKRPRRLCKMSASIFVAAEMKFPGKKKMSTKRNAHNFLVTHSSLALRITSRSIDINACVSWREPQYSFE